MLHENTWSNAHWLQLKPGIGVIGRVHQPSTIRLRKISTLSPVLDGDLSHGATDFFIQYGQVRNPHSDPTEKVKETSLASLPKFLAIYEFVLGENFLRGS